MTGRIRWWHRLTLRARLMIIGVVGVAVAITGAGIALDRILVTSIGNNLAAEAGAGADQVAALVDAGNVPDPLPVAGTLVIQVVDAQGRVLAGSAGADRLTALVPAAQLHAAADGRPVTVPGSRAAVSGELQVAVRTAGPASNPQYVLAAVSVSDVDRGTAALRTALLIADPVLLLVLAAIAWVVIGQALRPVEELRSAAERVSGTGDPDPLPVPAARDEIQALAVTLNDMLQRLTAARDRQRAFVDDAAHELRSPLASLRTQLEVAQRHGPTAELVDEALLDVERLGRIVADLLLLARSDARALPRRSDPVDAVEVVGAALDRVPAPVTRDLGSSPLFVEADPELLQRVVLNLVDNASRVRAELLAVALTATDREIVLVVDDDGPGIPPADRERVFLRFTRLDPARSGDSGGSGLGLPIVRELLRGMGGTVSLGDRPGGAGTRARVVLPRARPDVAQDVAVV